LRLLATVGLLPAVAGIALVFSCAGGRKAPSLSSDWTTGVLARHSPVPPLSPTTNIYPPWRDQQPTTALSEALAELSALPIPEGVDAGVFAQLKSALAEELSETRPSTRDFSPAGEARLKPSVLQEGRKFVSTPPTGPSNRVDDLEITDLGDGTYTLSWNYTNVGDYNQDGIVNIMDITPLAVHFQEPADSGNEWIDGNGDTVINIMDITPLAANFLCDCAGYSIRGADAPDAPEEGFTEIGMAAFSLAAGEGRKRFQVPLPESAFGYFAVAPFDSAGELGELSNVLKLLNQPPVADLIADKTAGEVPLLVHFDASASYDPDGSIIEFWWNFDGDATYDDTTTEPTNSHLYESGGNYNATVRVTDDEDAWDTAYVTISVNQPPVAVLFATPMEGPAPLLVDFDASESLDADGAIVSYEWDFDGDSEYEELTAEPASSHTYDAYGSYEAALRVTDDDGAQDTDSVTIEVNRPPMAELTADPSAGAIPLDVGFNAAGSHDPDGEIVQYEWDFDGDSTYDDTTAVPTDAHTYGCFGSFDAVVRVTDDDGAQDTDSVRVAVEGWVHTWGASDDDKARGLAPDSSGNLYVAGESRSFDPSSDVLLLKYASGGELAFGKTWGGTGLDYGRALVVDSSASAYLAGYTDSFGAGRSDVLLLKYGSGGNLLWQKTWGRDKDDEARAVCVDSLGNLYVTGYTDSGGLPGSREDFLLLKYDALGSLLWQRAWGGAEPDEAYAVAVDAGGNVYVAGYTSSFGNNYQDAVLLKCSSDGELVFSKTWGTDLGEERACAVEVDSVGNVYLAGYTKSFGAGGWDVLLLKYDASGNLVWEKTWGGSKDEIAVALRLDSAGNLYAAGWSASFCASGRDLLLLKWDSGGNLVFSKTWGGLTTKEASDLAVDASGNVFVAGLAVNAFGECQTVVGESSSPAGSAGTPTHSTYTLDGTETVPEGMEADVDGVADEGGGGDDALVINLGAQ